MLSSGWAELAEVSVPVRSTPISFSRRVRAQGTVREESCAPCSRDLELASNRHALTLNTDPYSSEILSLMQTLVKYRMSDLRGELGKIGQTTSMLHPDVLLLIYHFAKIATGNILEIGAFVGGSTIAAAMGARDSVTPKKFITVEPGGQLKKHRMATRNIFKDLTKNLSRHGVAAHVTALNGYSFDPVVVAAVRKEYKPGDVGFFSFDADDNVRRDLDLYGDLLADGCWVMIDDYVGSDEKAAPTRAYVDEFVATGKLVPLGYYGWSTWVGRWRVATAG